MYKEIGCKQWSCARISRFTRCLFLPRIQNSGVCSLLACQPHHRDAPYGQRYRIASSRYVTTNAGTLSRPERVESVSTCEPSGHDKHERTLKGVFDSRTTWREFSESSRSAQSGKGFLGIRFLATPEGFTAFVDTTKRKCDHLVAKTLAASTLEEYRRMARDMDSLSDLLCRVIDVADFARVFHHNAAMASAATEAYEHMFEYMNVLNTTAGLNEQLKKALSMPEVKSTWCEEEIISAETLIKDFAHSAIHQPPDKRQKFVELSNDISRIGTEFVSLMEPAKRYVAVPRKSLPTLDAAETRQFGQWGKAMVPIHSNAARQIMRLTENEESRREIYMAGRSASKKQIERLEQLLLKRAELAKLTGFSSYAQMVLSHKSALAKTTSGVNTFLTSLNASNRTQIKPQIEELLALKKQTFPDASVLQSWDVAFYQNALRLRSPQEDPASQHLQGLAAFFSLGTVMTGLSRLFQRLYGIRLMPRSTMPGEVWNPDVRRLDVISDTEGCIAVMYCDLFSRMGKQPNPAHFTLRCSREIPQEEIDAATSSDGQVNDGMPTGLAVSSVTGKRAVHQLPVIALICDFVEPAPQSRAPTLLSPNSVTTLFHEMGHAIHSILGRTSLQTIAGTRCAADFAELPSILMEYFALDPAVLRLYARHWETDAPISDMQAHALKQKHIQQTTDKEATWHNEVQILMSLLDQSLHSESAVTAIDHKDKDNDDDNNTITTTTTNTNTTFNSTQIYHQVWNQHGSIPEPAHNSTSTSWHALFGHLYGYGGTYYSYLFDRAIARQVWRVVFRDGVDAAALDPAAGHRLKEHLLRHGGGRDPWRCLEDLVGGAGAGAGRDGGNGSGSGSGVLAAGGDDAMLEVGRWGVGAGLEGGM